MLAMMMEELLKPEEVARLLNISEYTVKEMLRQGQIKGLKVRGRWRVRPEDVRAYLAAQEQDKK